MKIIWSKKALSDLDSAFSYILVDNSTAAISVYEKIMEHVELLLEHPDLGRSGRVVGTRELVLPKIPFIIPYRIKNNTVEIIRVFHTSRELKKKSVH